MCFMPSIVYSSFGVPVIGLSLLQCLLFVTVALFAVYKAKLEASALPSLFKTLSRKQALY